MPAFGLTHILLLFGVLQALQLNLVLSLRAANNRAAAACLQALLSVCGLLLVDYLLLMTGAVLAFPAVAGFSLPLLFALGPLLLAYVTCQSGSRPRWWWSWHLLPVLACALLLAPWWSMPPADKNAWLSSLLSSGYAGSYLVPLVLCLVLCLQLVIYSYHADVRLERYDAALQQQEAGTAVQLVHWLRLVTRGLCLFQLLFYLSWAEWLYADPVDWHYTALAMGCLALLLILAGLWSQLHPALFQQATLAPLPVLSQPPPEPKYGKNRLDGAPLVGHMSALEHCMRERQPYLDPELRLSGLAELAGINAHLLSQVINEGHGCNYFEYINRQRVAHAQALLQAAANGRANLLDVALASGFNSKATFNRSFRLVTGMTPSAYLAHCEQQRLQML
jgi:AraC-like DNA-binding protein